MEKLNLHDSLRIYLPGLLLSMLIYYILFDTLKDVSNVLLPAIFVGLLLDILSRRFYTDYFDRITDAPLFGFNEFKKSFEHSWKEIVYAQIQRESPAASKKLENSKNHLMINFVEKTFLNKVYNSDGLLVFRAPKSFGILCFNSSIACYIGYFTLIFHDNMLRLNECCNLWSSFFVSISMLFVSTILLLGCRFYFIDSINKELAFWCSLTNANIKDIIYLIELGDQINVQQEVRDRSD